jgi:hypothetical protein
MYFDVIEHILDCDRVVCTLLSPKLTDLEKEIAFATIERDPNLQNVSTRDQVSVDLLAKITEYSNPLGVDANTRCTIEDILGYSFKFFRRALSNQYPEVMTLDSLEDFFERKGIATSSHYIPSQKYDGQWTIDVIEEKKTISFGGLLPVPLGSSNSPESPSRTLIDPCTSVMTEKQRLELKGLLDDLIEIGYLCDPDHLWIDDLPQMWELFSPETSQLLEIFLDYITSP